MSPTLFGSWISSQGWCSFVILLLIRTEKPLGAMRNLMKGMGFIYVDRVLAYMQSQVSHIAGMMVNACNSSIW